MRRTRGVWALLGLIVVVGGLLAPAAVVAENGPGQQGAEVSEAVKHDVSPPLRQLHVPSPDAVRDTEKPLHRINVGRGNGPDGALQTTIGPEVAVTSQTGFDGLGLGAYGFDMQYAPPDTNGAVGKYQYVQWVNAMYAVFDKSTHAIVPGFPKYGNAIWAGFGGGCQTNNDGDPIVQYDKIADRWILTQFSVSTKPYLQCVAISTTADATGSYYRYAFSYGSSDFPDYPKLGVWPDAYYISYNVFGRIFFKGAKLCAFDRSAMLVGAQATQQCFQLSSAYGGLLPTDLDGSTASLQQGGSGLPPAGAPNLFVAFGSNVLQVWKFHVDWNNTANTSLSGPTNIGVQPFSTACNGGGTCIPQKGTSQKLDSLGDRLMYRLAYRHFADGHASLVVNHSVSVGGVTSVRWYELRLTGSSTNPTIHQQGTLSASDGVHRWMGSIAMDASGDMALGYSASNSSQYPSIRLTGRLNNDPLGLGNMQSETTLVSGSGSQLSNLSRWGDYSAMTVDPVDDCTFWFTSEYLKSNGTWNWSTWIESFQFSECTGGGGGGPTTGTVSGHVQDASTNAAIAGATLSISGSTKATTDQNGDYTFDIAGGTYNITASASGYTASTANGVAVTNGSTTTQDFSLTSNAPTTGTLSGTVTDANTASPIAGATVSISGGPSTSTDGSGHYSFTIAGGTYDVTASATGYNDSTASGVSVTNGLTTTQDIALTPSGGGTATVPGQPAAPDASVGKGKGVMVTWSAPAADGGSAITGYTVYRYLNCTGPSDASFSSSNTQLKDTSTSKGSDYCYTVAALNAVGEGPQSDPSITVTVLK